MLFAEMLKILRAFDGQSTPEIALDDLVLQDELAIHATRRRIRDWEGSEGWVYHSLLSGKRTALLAPKDKTQLVPLYDSSDGDGAVVAQLQAGVQASVKRCTGTLCRIAGPRFDGWVRQEQLWGVYANEKIE